MKELNRTIGKIGRIVELENDIKVNRRIGNVVRSHHEKDVILTRKIGGIVESENDFSRT